MPFSARQHALARKRIALTVGEFVDRIAAQGGDRRAAAALWERLRDWSHVDGFTPHPTDDLQSVFGIAEEELDEDLILAILKELDVPVPGDAVVGEFGPVDTPLRVAQFVARAREQRSDANGNHAE